MSHEIVRVLNASCDPKYIALDPGKKWYGHENCPGVSRGTKSDPVDFVCVCECHNPKPPETYFMEDRE